MQFSRAFSPTQFIKLRGICTLLKTFELKLKVWILIWIYFQLHAKIIARDNWRFLILLGSTVGEKNYLYPWNSGTGGKILYVIVQIFTFLTEHHFMQNVLSLAKFNNTAGKWTWSDMYFEHSVRRIRQYDSALTADWTYTSSSSWGGIPLLLTGRNGTQSWRSRSPHLEKDQAWGEHPFSNCSLTLHGQTTERHYLLC